MKSGLLATFGVVAVVAIAGCSGANDSPITAPPGSSSGGDDGGSFDGTSGQAVLGLSAMSQDFGTFGVGQQSPPVVITVTNTGGAPSGKLKATVGGANVNAFLVDMDGCTGQVLAPAAKCGVTVHFSPTAAGKLTATLAFADDAGNSANAALTGNGTQQADITLLPAMQDFGTVQVSASSAPTTFTLANGGMMDAGVVTLKLTGPDAEQFSPSMDTCSGNPLMAGARCSIVIAFTPSTPMPQAKMATLTASIAGGQTVTSALTGLAKTGAAFQISHGGMPVTSTDFGMQTIGTPGSVDYTVTNTGGVMSGVPAITVTGPNMADFAVMKNTCTATLAASGTCGFSVTFTPTAAASEQATVGVAAPGTASASVDLTGQGEPPAALQASPMSHQFGNVVQGGNSAPETFTITNTGASKSGPLTVYLSGPDKGQFTLGSDSCASAQLDGGGTCTVAVTFTPDSNGGGAVHANLNVAGTPGGTASAGLDGTVDTLASLSIGPDPYDYGNVAQNMATTPVDFTVTNGGSLPSGSPTVTKGGANPNDFSIVADNCTGNAIPGNGTCTVSVSFKPSTMAPESATITVAASPGGAVTANLSGTGTTAAALQIKPNPFGFGDVVQNMPSGNKTFNVSNTGGVSSGPVVMSIGGMNSGDFHVVADNCKGKTLPANNAMACTVIVFFKPATLNQESASLTAVANPGGTATDTLTGNGVTQGTLGVDHNPAVLPNVNKGSSSKLTLQVNNTGGAPSGVPMVSVTPGNPVSTDFTVTGNTCTKALPPMTNNACQIEITFTPSTVGTQETATLNIAANPGGTTVPLSGTGTQPSIAIAPAGPSPCSFTAQPGHTQSCPFTVTNNGSGPTGMLSVAIPMPSNGFSVTTDGCSTLTAPNYLAGGLTCPITVQYAPPMGEALGNTDTAKVVVTDAATIDPTSPASANLSGQTLYASSYLVITPNPVTFAAVMNGMTSQIFTVHNYGQTLSPMFTPTVTPTDVTQKLDFSATNCTPASPLAAYPATCTYTVTFNAPSNGDGGLITTFSGTTQVVDNAVTPTMTYAQASFQSGM